MGQNWSSFAAISRGRISREKCLAKSFLVLARNARNARNVPVYSQFFVKPIWNLCSLQFFPSTYFSESNWNKFSFVKTIWRVFSQHFFSFSVPGDSSWVVLDSNGSSNRELESQGPSQQPEKMDIFSQALVSTKIDEFTANHNLVKRSNFECYEVSPFLSKIHLKFQIYVGKRN